MLSTISRIFRCASFFQRGPTGAWFRKPIEKNLGLAERKFHFSCETNQENAVEYVVRSNAFGRLYGVERKGVQPFHNSGSQKRLDQTARPVPQSSSHNPSGPRGLNPDSRDVAKKLVLTRNLLAIRILKAAV
jgi:hypothetical protein